MSIKPILFNTEMVRAILQDRKVVTRRVVKDPVPDGAVWGLRRFTHQDRAFCHWEVGGELFGRYFKLPYCVGDTLYVRETWCNANEPGIEPDYHYFADTCEDYDQTGWTWRPSIHMPKDAARIWLKVIDVKLEQLQDMVLGDFLDEGMAVRPEAFNDPENAYLQARDQFMGTWGSTIKGKDAEEYGWSANPWVWVVRFERCNKPGREG